MGAPDPIEDTKPGPDAGPGPRRPAGRRLLRPLWVALAVLFLIEAWLWETLEPVVERIVAWLPWARFKATVATAVGKLPPWATLIVFAVPLIAFTPFNLAAVWLAAQGQVVLATAVYLFAKIVGLGVTAFLFEACKPKLLQLGWFAALYRWVLWAKAWASAQVAPYRAAIGEALRWVRTKAAAVVPRGKLLAKLSAIRRRMRRAPSSS